MAARELAARITCQKNTTQKGKFLKYQCIWMSSQLSTAILIMESCPSGKLFGGKLCTWLTTTLRWKIRWRLSLPCYNPYFIHDVNLKLCAFLYYLVCIVHCDSIESIHCLLNYPNLPDLIGLIMLFFWEVFVEYELI